MLRGPGLTPHKIRAERSSNLSFQKLRGAGLTPHFRDERSSNLSEFFPLLATFPSSIVARFDHRYLNQGPPCGRAALRVCSSLLLGTTTLFSDHVGHRLRLTYVAHESEKPGVFSKNQRTVSVQWVRTKPRC